MKRGLRVTKSESNLSTFRLNAQVVIRVKVWTNIAIYSHALLRIHVIGGQGSVRIATPSLPPHHSGPCNNQGLPVLHLGWCALLKGSSGSAGSPSLTATFLCQHCGLLLVDWVAGIPCMLYFFIISYRRYLSAPSASSPCSLPDVDLAAVAGDTIYPVGLLTKR